eukprot:GHRR01015573.1.p1 GENE.GHRR01015573.1~~GHRR01015573.1.p1  ORF type:complete len:335 (+),score=75.55 GHRR01015573.1:764-1768(+)
MACRSMDKAKSACEDILRDPRNAGPLGNAAKRLIPMHLDLEDFATIKDFVQDFRALQLNGLHLLVNNAGAHLPFHKQVDCGFNRVIASNYFGHFWLTQLLLEDLKASAPSRIINMASVAEQLSMLALYTTKIHWDDLRGRHLPDSGERPYTISKVYILMESRELARRLEGTGVDVIAVHPGIANSTWFLKSDPRYLFAWLVDRTRALLGDWVGVGQSVETGAISTIYASIAPELTGITSSIESYGIWDSICRSLFGGRLRYYGPSYLMLRLLQNWNNTGRCYPLTPWVYNKAACKRLFEGTQELIKEVEMELAQPNKGFTRVQGTASNGMARSA